MEAEIFFSKGRHIVRRKRKGGQNRKRESRVTEVETPLIALRRDVLCLVIDDTLLQSDVWRVGSFLYCGYFTAVQLS
jgi:hypothetical protein